MPKVRLDQYLQALGLTASREQARRLIMAGEVTVNGQVVDRPGSMVAEGVPVAIKARPRFVSRGGEKLEAALVAFGVAVAGRVCADVGASTGGFTDCLLQRGAARVYAIDVGRGILDYGLRTDPRVVVMEETNARYVESLPERVQFVSIDASFISLKLLLPVAKAWLAEDGQLVALIKPQFEAGRKEVARGDGVVRDPEVHRRVVGDILTFAEGQALGVQGLIASPLRGPKGNVEFLAWLAPGRPAGDWQPLLDAALAQAALIGSE